MDVEIRVFDQGLFARWRVGVRGAEALLGCHERGFDPCKVVIKFAGYGVLG